MRAAPAQSPKRKRGTAERCPSRLRGLVLFPLTSLWDEDESGIHLEQTGRDGWRRPWISNPVGEPGKALWSVRFRRQSSPRTDLSHVRRDFVHCCVRILLSIAASLPAVPQWGVRTRTGIRDIHRSTITGHGIPSFDLPRSASRWRDRALSQYAFSAGGPQEDRSFEGPSHVDDRISGGPALRLVRLVLFVSAR